MSVPGIPCVMAFGYLSRCERQGEKRGWFQCLPVPGFPSVMPFFYLLQDAKGGGFSMCPDLAFSLSCL